MEIINQEYELVPVAGLRPHPKNPRKGDTVAIADSIVHNGFYGAVVAQRSTGYILAGNHRHKAAADTGADEVPTIWVDCDDEQALRILLADNRTNDLAGYDEKALAELLSGLDSLDGTGYDQAALDEFLAGIDEATASASDDAPEAQTDRAEELREKWNTERGQLWVIPSASLAGKEHRLLCGDSMVATDVDRVLAGAKPVLMVTDPPYGVEYDANWRNEADRANGKAYGARAIGKIANDDRADWTEAWALFPGQVVYVWHADRHATTVENSLRACGFEIRNQVIWAKNNFAISRGHYHWQHEPCWYAVRKGANANWQGDRSQTTLWQIDKPLKSETGHSSQKPVECMARPIRNHCGRGDSVYEPFSGSGSTFVAAEQFGATCYGIELEPKYVAVILERLSEMGLEPRLATN